MVDTRAVIKVVWIRVLKNNNGIREGAGQECDKPEKLWSRWCLKHLSGRGNARLEVIDMTIALC